MIDQTAVKQIENRIKPNTFVTLSVKQGIQNSAGTFIAGSPEVYDRVFAALMSEVNLRLYGKRRWRRNRKRLLNISTVERSKGGLWHLHACIRRPEHVSIGEFENILRNCWRKSQWYMPVFEVAEFRNNGVRYILKGGQDTILTKPSFF